MLKKYIMAPGPTEVPPAVLLRAAAPIMHHRTAEFSEIFSSVSEGLKYVFQTKNSVLMMCSSGTGAMQGAVSNFLSPGDKAIVVRGGKFGERWGEICEEFGIQVVAIDVTWGEAVQPDTVATALEDNADAKAVYVTLCETSTGTLTDVQAIGEIVSKTGAILVVDTVSAIGAEKCLTDEWKLDVVVAGSQKALMLPPGLACVSVSEKAWELAKSSKCSDYYFDFTKTQKSLAKDSTPYTPAVSLVCSLDESLKMIKDEGIENVWGRTAALGKAMRAGLTGMGLELFSKSPANAVTAVKIPEGVDGGALPKKVRVEYGVTIAGGQESLKGKIFRVSNMGYADMLDVPMAISVLSMALRELGYEAKTGQGIEAALDILYDYKTRS